MGTLYIKAEDVYKLVEPTGIARVHCSQIDELPKVFINKDLAELSKANDDLEMTLTGVMFFVDKWLEDDELKQDEVNRAITMREKTLRIIEDLESGAKEEGEWLMTDAYPSHLYCSLCYATALPNVEYKERWGLKMNYCPNCGARMKGGE